MNFRATQAVKVMHAGALVVAALVILAVNVIRFAGLEQSPPGFHVDELSGAVTVQCLETEGVDATGKPYPLFANLNYGSPKPPTYLYPAILWTRLFGHSIGSYRAFSAFITVMAIGMLFALARRMFGWEAAVWAALTASLSPTVFQISRVALEPGLAPFFVMAGIFCLLGRRPYVGAVLGGLMFALAMYSYPPARLFVPLFLMLFVVTRWLRGSRRLGPVFALGAALVIVNIPLVLGTLSGEYMGRFNKIGIFSEEFLAEQGKARRLKDIAGIFVQNYAQHLRPDFLFINGDENFVYSTGRFGLLGWLDMLALALGIVLVIFEVCRSTRGASRLKLSDITVSVELIGGILLAIVPAALTWQDIPHSLRMLLYWPFLALLSGWVLSTLCRRAPFVAPVILAVAVGFGTVYLRHYFKVYPERAYYMFSTFTKDEALSARTQEDWMKFMYRYRRQDYHTRYYMMNFLKGQTCASSQRAWQEVHKIP
ncbi:MAG: glycosyltransferase family 39 protein [Candidatus Omnitrophica bacterium]|nr:glycosyltransferase family 39 protein [Candidatus Omnitrophota bacterium]